MLLLLLLLFLLLLWPLYYYSYYNHFYYPSNPTTPTTTTPITHSTIMTSILIEKTFPGYWIAIPLRIKWLLKHYCLSLFIPSCPYLLNSLTLLQKTIHPHNCELPLRWDLPRDSWMPLSFSKFQSPALYIHFQTVLHSFSPRNSLWNRFSDPFPSPKS